MANSRMSGSTGTPRTTPKTGSKSAPKRSAPSRATSTYDPERPGKFDLSGFINGTQTFLPQKVVHVTREPTLGADLEQLLKEIDGVTAERDNLERAAERARAEQRAEGSGPRERMVGPARSPRLLQLDARLEKLLADRDELLPQLEGTWAAVKVRGLDPQEQDEVRKLGRENGLPLALAIFSRACLVGPEDADEDDPEAWMELTEEQWAGFVQAIGHPQYLLLDGLYAGLAYKSVTPDFYARLSASRATESSS